MPLVPVPTPPARAALAALLTQTRKGKPRVRMTGQNVGTVWSGWRVIGGERQFWRSRSDYRYACYLEWLRVNGHILAWTYEAETFDFTQPRKVNGRWLKGVKHGVTTNKIDFEVIDFTGLYVVVEVKGFMDPKSKTRLRRMGRYYPEVPVELVGPKELRAIAALSSLIPGWE